MAKFDTKAWIESLTREQANEIMVELLEYAEIAEFVRYGDLAPYWEATGEPLLSGQKVWIYEDDED